VARGTWLNVVMVVVVVVVMVMGGKRNMA